MRQPTRSKKKPPNGSMCDSMVGVDQDARNPRLKRCPNKATVELLGVAPVYETWVCESCAAHYLENET